jgi:hypothetical protein
MSYWILPESGIPVSVTTVQRVANTELSTDEMKACMREYDNKLQVYFDAQSVDVSRHLRDVDFHQIIDHENEDPAFFDEFTRVINDA